jgi:hypothetical protein
MVIDKAYVNRAVNRDIRRSRAERIYEKIENLEKGINESRRILSSNSYDPRNRIHAVRARYAINNYKKEITKLKSKLRRLANKQNIKIKPPSNVYKPPNQSRNVTNRRNTHVAPSRNKKFSNFLRKKLNDILTKATPSMMIPGKFAVNTNNEYRYRQLKENARKVYSYPGGYANRTRFLQNFNKLVVNFRPSNRPNNNTTVGYHRRRGSVGLGYHGMRVASMLDRLGFRNAYIHI